jgi:hypothetical protein
MEKNGHHKKGERVTMAAVYVNQGPLSPVYATFEPRDEGGGVEKVEIDYVLRVLQHEVTHQIGREYSNFAHGGEGTGEYQYWCVEGVAVFMENFKLGRTGWTLAHPNPKNGKSDEYAFHWCKENPHLPQSLEGFFRLSHDNFVKANHYELAGGVSYFLLEGEGRKYRKGFLELLQRVHRGNDSKSMLGECFPGVDFDKMHKEYKQFIADLKLDPEQKAN